MATARDLAGAIQAGDSGKFKQLLDSDPSLAAARDGRGISLLMLALYHRQRGMAEAMAEAKPSLDIFEAAALGREQRIEELLRQDTSLALAWSADGFTALGLACFFGHEAAARLLADGGAEVGATARNAMKVQPLHAAAASGKASIVKMLLEHGADPNARQQMGWTALHEAAQNGDVEMARHLLAHGADPNAANDEGKTVASVAESKGHKKIVELLGG